MSPDRYTISDDGCWIWNGYADRNGYGRIHNGKTRTVEWAHRYSWTEANGPIPDRHHIDHMCQTPLCVNPGHLQVVTPAEHARITFERAGKNDLHRAAASLRRNGYTYAEIADALSFSGAQGAFGAVRAAIDKGLIDGDECPPVPRLSDEEREEIRALYAAGFPQTAIGRCYGVDSSHISRVCSGMTSGHSPRSEAS